MKDFALQTPSVLSATNFDPVHVSADKHDTEVSAFPENPLNLLPEELSQVLESPSRSPSPVSRPEIIENFGECSRHRPDDVDSPPVSSETKPNQDPTPSTINVCDQEQLATTEIAATAKRKLGEIDFSTSTCSASECSSISPRYVANLNSYMHMIM